jgi:hypothetical protein
MVLMGYKGARVTLIYEKNLMSKISCQTPFKMDPDGRGPKSKFSHLYHKYSNYCTYNFCFNLF